MKPGEKLKVEACMDASFAMHLDEKSHMRVVVLIGGVGVFFALQKQKYASKSPMKVELVTL